MYRESDSTLSAEETATRLGVKVQTVYAYVSRGLLARVNTTGKQSRFDAAEVERLATRGRGASGPKPEPVLVKSALTAIAQTSIHYRGRDAIELARGARFEQVAQWLWGVPAESSVQVFAAQKAAVSLAHAAQAALPRQTLPLDRLRVIATVLGTSDAMRHETSRSAVLATARALISGMVDGLPRTSARPRDDSLAARLWSRLSALPPSAARVHVLDLAMGLCADHALSPSTLAVRIAASQRADPYAVVQTGMGALSSALHGAASLAAEGLLAELESGGDPSAVIGARLRRGEKIPGFGQPLHPAGDPRATELLASLARTFGKTRAVHAARAANAVMRARGLPPPNVDFALATLTRAAHMLPGSSEAIMSIARVAGWIAHALEEYAAPTAFPWHALYVGPRPEAAVR